MCENCKDGQVPGSACIICNDIIVLTKEEILEQISRREQYITKHRKERGEMKKKMWDLCDDISHKNNTIYRLKDIIHKFEDKIKDLDKYSPEELKSIYKAQAITDAKYAADCYAEHLKKISKE